jgi:hypothetical protein
MITDTLPTESFNVETVTRPRIGPLLIWDVTDTSRRRQFFHGTEGQYKNLYKEILACLQY